MIRDLENGGAPDHLTADVVVIGAGIAGLLLATRLARAGKRVLVLESGGERQDGDTHPLNEVVHRRSVYAGAVEGRFRCLGGTSTRWGGAMLPFVTADLTDGGWPVALSEFTAYLPEVEQIFSLPSGPYDLPEMVSRTDGADIAYTARLAKWPSFGRRNVAALLAEQIASPNGPEIWLHAHATGFAFAEDGRVDGITAQSGTGNHLTVTASEIVIAAGAIESTRLLLLLDRQAGDRILAPHGVIGRYFHDHISARVASVTPRDLRRLNRTLGFRFQRGGMRNLRFETSELASVRAQVPAGFAHLSFTDQPRSGFGALREIYRRLQQRRLPDLSIVTSLAASAPWLFRAAWWRFVERRLLYPQGAELEMVFSVEQKPVAGNMVGLSSVRQDQFGQPLAEIDWGISGDDIAALNTSASVFKEEWDNSSLAALGQLMLHPADAVAQAVIGSGGIFHPGGTTRLGRSAADGVVDKDFRVFGVPNLSVVATSTFPTGGGANPTMMLMMAALRTADRLAASS